RRTDICPSGAPYVAPVRLGESPPRPHAAQSIERQSVPRRLVPSAAASSVGHAVDSPAGAAPPPQAARRQALAIGRIANAPHCMPLAAPPRTTHLPAVSLRRTVWRHREAAGESTVAAAQSVAGGGDPAGRRAIRSARRVDRRAIEAPASRA